MSYGKKIKRALKRGNTAKADRLKIKQANRKAKRVTLYTPGKKNGTVTIGRQKFNKLAKYDSRPVTSKTSSDGRVLNQGGLYATGSESGGKSVKTLLKKLGMDSLSNGDNYAKASRALRYSTAAPVQTVTKQVASDGGSSDASNTSTSFDAELARINESYAAENNRLSSLMSDQQAEYDAIAADQDRRMSNLSNAIANSSSQYDPTKNLGASNNINPALTVQEQNKTLSQGTQRYNRNSALNIQNVNV